MRKPRQNSPQMPPHVRLGGKDLDVFIKQDMFYKGLENISTNAEHSNRIVECLLSEAAAKKNRAPKARKMAKKRKIVESEDELTIQDDEMEDDTSA